MERRVRRRRAQLKILSKGSEVWNRWRRANPHIQPMLAGCDFTRELKGLHFDDYDFSYTNLTEAILKGVHLKRANFHQAILAAADLSRAHLQEANVCRTDLYQTNFDFRWVQAPIQYDTTDQLIAELHTRVIRPALDEEDRQIKSRAYADRRSVQRRKSVKRRSGHRRK